LLETVFPSRFVACNARESEVSTFSKLKHWLVGTNEEYEYEDEFDDIEESGDEAYSPDLPLYQKKKRASSVVGIKLTQVVKGM
jgi:hypothetical protein